MGKEIPSSQGNDILLFQLIGRIFHKRKLQQLTGIVLHQLITVPGLPTNLEKSRLYSLPGAEAAACRSLAPFSPSHAGWTRDKHLIQG